MSSTTTPAAAAAGAGVDGLGNGCLVCGKPVTGRCSPCFAKSHIELGFCSKEHQKLAWPFHKLVCGERAHPFRLPPYSQEEADLAFKRIFEPLQDEANRDMRDIMRSYFKARIDIDDAAQLRAHINKLVGHESELVRVPDELPDGHSTDELTAIAIIMRACASEWDPSESFKTGKTRLLEEPRAYFDLRSDHRLETGSLWHSTLCHMIGFETAYWAGVSDRALSTREATDRPTPAQTAQLRMDQLLQRLRILQSSSAPPSATAFRLDAAERTQDALDEAKTLWDSLERLLAYL